ncbi:glycosyltransferase family 2 protein [Roseibium aestuarii]|uniref:Glycosyltransferase family 2 protein n=1 Tax=Roseibium aestuarii TaxID=2600299 RepID=A0ABW4JY65_9HYPH|nr:glycosyltransferase family A protein [Roseibium aestuarii]
MNDRPLKIGILVCTAGRPQMLLRCLASLAAQQVPDHVSLEVHVVENDKVPHSREAVKAFAASAPVTVHYAQEPRRGIPFARNRTLTEATGRGYDWIALIDDDEEAHPDWIARHLASLARHGGRISRGPVVPHYEQQPPEWWPGYVPETQPEGTVLTRSNTGNVVFDASLLEEPTSLRFNEVFLYGYEDLDFFERAHGLGYKIIWTPSAVVEEDVPASRVQPQRIYAWARSSAAAHVQVGILRKGYGRSFLKFSIKGLRRILAGSIGVVLFGALMWTGLPKTRRLYHRSRLKIARGTGNWLGLRSAQNGYYDVIDGR